MKRFNKLPKTPQGIKLVEAARQRKRERLQNEFISNFNGNFHYMTDKERIEYRNTINKLKRI